MMRRWIAGLVLPILLAACTFGSKTDRSRQVPITVTEIVHEYEVAGEAADIIFSGRRLTLSGAVGRTGESRRGIPFIEFSSGSWSVLATFPPHYAHDVTALQPGATVTLDCQSAATHRRVRMGDCRITN